MSSRIRFATARNVFEAFPDMRQVVGPPTDDAAPLDFARRLLAAPRLGEAIAFLAYVLPRREAVWWARQCVGAMLGQTAENDPALRAADAWVRAPEEEHRQVALSIGLAGDQQIATTWLALAAAWSGGSMCPPDVKPMPAPNWACAKAVNAAIAISTISEPQAIAERLKACAESGIRFAEGGDARPVVPSKRA